MLTLCNCGGSVFTFLLLTLLQHESGQLKNKNKNKKNIDMMNCEVVKCHPLDSYRYKYSLRLKNGYK